MRKELLLVALLIALAAAAAWMVLSGDSARDGGAAKDRSANEVDQAEPGPAALVGGAHQEADTRTAVSTQEAAEQARTAEVQEHLQDREPTIEPGPAVVHHLVVIDAPTGTPIAAASVERHRVGNGGPQEVRTTGLDGRAELTLTGRDFLRVVAEGYAPVVFSPDQGSGTSIEEASIVAMRIPAALFGVVTDVQGAPRAGVRVLASKLGMERFGFPIETRTDGTGAYRLEVQPRARFRPRLVGTDGETLRDEPDWWMLEPGEEREVNWRVGDAALVTGVAFDQTGKPVGALPVMLYESWSPQRQYVTNPTNSRIRAATVTHANGSFDLGKVPVGRYVLAPGGRRGEAAIPDDVAAFGEELQVDGRTPSIHRELRVWRGLTVTGRVVYPDGRPAGACGVGGWPDGADGILNATADADGNFELGPLAAGLIGLEVEHLGFGVWKPVKVQAGARDVLLVLTKGGSLRGQVEPRTTETADGGQPGHRRLREHPAVQGFALQRFHRRNQPRRRRRVFHERTCPGLLRRRGLDRGRKNRAHPGR